MTKKSVSRQGYYKSITALEKQLKDPELLIDKVPKLQEQLVKIAEKYQDDESIGQERYKIYELQALIFFYQDNDEEALNLLDSARTVYGESYDYERNLRKQILEGNFSLNKRGGLTKILFSNFDGRMNRFEYFIGAVLVNIVAGGIWAFPVIFANISDTAAAIFTFISYIVSIGYIGVGAGLLIRRLHDIGVSGGYAFLAFVPLANLILAMVTLLWPGEPHKNKYGNRP